MNRKTLLIIGIFIVVGIIFFIGWKYYQSYWQSKFTNGDVMPDIRLTNQINDSLSLYSLKGNIVLVQFWASWCGPCRIENHMLVNLYSKFQNTEMKDGGTFKIFSISVDKNTDDWIEAVVNDKMIWPEQVIDIESREAKKFNVHSIPTTFLIDQSGIIIGLNLSTIQIESVLEKRIKKFTVEF